MTDRTLEEDISEKFKLIDRLAEKNNGQTFVFNAADARVAKVRYLGNILAQDQRQR